MTIERTWKCATALLLSAGLAACNSSSDNDHRAPDNVDNGPDHSEHYTDIGLQPDRLPDQEASDELRAAIQAGYVGFGTMLAMLDLRMDLQSYDASALPQFATRAVAEGVSAEEGTEDAPYPTRADIDCEWQNAAGYSHGDATTSIAIFYWNGDGDGYDWGDEVRFGFNDCAPSNGATLFTSDGHDVADPRVQRFQRTLGPEQYRFELNAAQVDRLPGFTLDGALIREVEDRDTTQMTVSNRAFDDGSAARFEFSGQGGGEPVRLRVLGAEDGAETPAIIRTRKPDDDLYVEVPTLSVSLSYGEDDLGVFVFRTVDDLVLDYGTPPTVRSGIFEVTAPDGTVYTFLADEVSHRELLVSADDEELGLIAPEFLINRLRLQ